MSGLFAECDSKRAGWAILICAGIAVVLWWAWPKINGGFFTRDQYVVLPAHGRAPPLKARVKFGLESNPIIVDLPHWSGDHRGSTGTDMRLDQAVERRSWSIVRPNLSEAGRNDTPDGCCSEKILDAIKGAMAYGRARISGPMFLVGGSGGGYVGLCAALRLGEQPRAIFAWVPITDLEAWAAQSAGKKPASDVHACTRSGATLDSAEARRRSPLYMTIPPGQLADVYVYHGVHDGAFGPVSPLHSVRFYNRFIRDSALDAPQIDDAEIMNLVEFRKGPHTRFGKTIGGRAVHVERRAGPLRLLIFEGGHEVLIGETIAEIERIIRAENR